MAAFTNAIQFATMKPGPERDAFARKVGFNVPPRPAPVNQAKPAVRADPPGSSILTGGQGSSSSTRTQRKTLLGS